MAVSPIRLISRNIFNLDSNVPTDWLLANKGDLIRIETIFTIQNEVIGSEGEPFIINNKDGYLEDGWLTDSTYRFKNFKVGDQVYFYNYFVGSPVDTGNFTVVEKLSDGEIRIFPAPTSPPNTSAAQGVLSNKTPITAIKYHYNFVENASPDSFLSMIDGNEQMFTIDTKLADDTSLSDMKAHGPITWQDSNPNIKIQGVSIELIPVYKTTYKIIHYTQVTPYIIYEQLQNQLDGLPDKDFELTKCWKLITQIEASEVFTNPNFLVSETFNDVLGNSGDYNENFNTGSTKFTSLNLTYTNNNKLIDAIQFDDSETLIEFDIDKSGANFTNGQIIRIGFFKVPSDPIEYQNNDEFADINFLIDGAKIIVGDPEGPGYGYNPDRGLGSVYRASAKIILPTKIKVSVRIRMGGSVLDKFLISSTPRYFLFASIKEQIYDTLSPLNDQVTLQIALSEFYYVTDDPGMIVIDKNVYLQHPDHDPSIEGTNTSDLLPPYADARIEFTFNLTASETAIIYIVRPVGDPKYGEVLGVADWQGSEIATANKLMDSINDQVSYGTLPPPFISQNTTENFAAALNISTYFTFLIQSPSGSKSKYNGTTILLKQPSGIKNINNQLFYGGYDGSKNILQVFPEDEIVACTNFYIERNTRETDDIRLTSVEAKIIATNTSDPFNPLEFDLEKFPIQLASVALTGDTQQFDITLKKPYHLPDSEPRKIFNIKRRNDLDTGSKKYFSIQHPFIWRWEYWEKLMGANAFFFNATQPNNGLNQNWNRYYTGSWKTQYQLIVNATKNGIKQQYKYTDSILPHGYASNTRYVTKKIELFDPDTLDSLFLNSRWNIPTDKKTLIVATFSVTGLLDQCTVVIHMETFEKGGITGTRSYSSRWVRDGDTWLASTNDDGLIDLIVSGDTATAKCLIDNSLLQQGSDVSISARIYEYGTVPHRFLTNDADASSPLTNDNGDNFIL